MREANPDYEADFAAWAERQAALVRAGRFAELDVENVAEELEAMCRSLTHELRSRHLVLMAHLLKYEFQPGERNLRDASDKHGAAFHEAAFESVVGSIVAAQSGLKVGDEIQPTHGIGGDGHKNDGFKVVATLAAGEAAPVRFIATLTSGQSIVLSVPQGPNVTPREVEIRRSGDLVTVSDATPAEPLV